MCPALRRAFIKIKTDVQFLTFLKTLKEFKSVRPQQQFYAPKTFKNK